MVNVAGIDIGTNSVRLLILSAEGQELAREMEITRLGQGVDSSGSLHPQAIARTLSVLRRYASLLTQHDVQSVRATATSAARDASNRDALFGPARELLCQDLELLSGADEAKLSFLGATADLPPGPKRVVFDIGGGSTEFAFGRHAPEAFLSLDMGGVRVTERFLAGDPPRPAELESAVDFVLSLLPRVEATLPLSEADSWLGLAGTVTTFASLNLGLTHYDATKTHGSTLTLENVERICETLSRATIAERERMLLEPKRAGVIVGGAVILRTLMRRFGVGTIQVSEKDILDGLAASALSRPAELSR